MSGLLDSTRTAIRRFFALTPLFVALTTLLFVLLSILSLDIPYALRAAVVGWVFATPVSAILAWTVLGLRPPELPGRIDPFPAAVERERRDRTRRATGTDAGTGTDRDADDPVAVLRERFARGEIDQAEFEERLDRLLETEGPASGTWAPGRRSAGSDRTGGREPADGRRDRETEST